MFPEPATPAQVLSNLSLAYQQRDLEHDQESRPFIRVSNVHLSVRTRTTPGQPFEYRVPGTTGVFYFRERAAANSTSKEREITRWVEDWPRTSRPAADSFGLEFEETGWGPDYARLRA